MIHAKKLLYVFLVLASHITAALEIMPTTRPFNGSIKVVYTPSFEARCISKVTEHDSSQQFDNSKVSVINISVIEVSPNNVKLSITGDIDGKSGTVTIPINSDGTGLIFDGLEFNNIPMTDKERSALNEAKKILAPFFEKIIGNRYESFNVGSDRSSANFCSLFPNGRTISKSGSFTVIGTAIIRGRENIVSGGDQSMTCEIDNNRLSIKIKGWEAIDRHSGLPSDASTSMEASVEGSGDTIMSVVENRVCSITGKALRQTSPLPNATTELKSVEQRLNELKALLDKRLISQEQYQIKSTEIIESL